MSILEIKDSISKMTRLEREEILRHILQFNSSDELTLPAENASILASRLKKIDAGQIELVDGKKAMEGIAKKFNVKA